MGNPTEKEMYEFLFGTTVQNPVQKQDKPKLTFKRDEKGVLWSYDVTTGKKVGRIIEHGDDPDGIDEIEE